mmetsp:Transcript_5676/g.16874  ORF Transcript_5676/g.16874 Transcript_5676/m.16874 type:complete len:1804 (+) Transcript_5676:72-5483(+)
MVAEVLGLFPRGKGPAGSQKDKDTKPERKRKQRDVLFDERRQNGGRVEGVPPKTAKKKRKRHVTEELDAGGEPEAALKIGRSLTFASLSVGSLLLGVVKSVGRRWIEVSLPFNLVGYLPSEEVLVESDEDMATSLREMPDEGEVGPRPLSGLLQENQLVPVSVARIGKSKSGRKVVELSMSLAGLNRGLAWNQLGAGSALLGAVKSKEEHGYILTLGDHVDFSAFLPFDKCDQADELHVGYPVRCTVDETVPAGRKKRSVRVCSQSSTVNTAVTDIYDGMTLSNLRVGALVSASVTKVLSTGASVNFMSVFNALVDAVHFPRSVQDPATLTKKKHQARITYLDVGTKRIYLSMREEICQEFSPPRVSAEYTVGAMLEDAVVTRLQQDHGIFLARENDKVPLFCHISHLSDERVENIAKLFKVGQTCRCRVIGIAALDGLVNVSLKGSVLEQLALRYDDIEPGTHVDAVVESLDSHGCHVSIGGTLKGIIPPEHLSDVKLVKSAKERFKNGTSVPCIVLSVAPRRRNVTLTAKRSLVKSSAPVLSSFEEAKRSVGGTCTGYVVGRTSALGVLVGFCGGVRGLIPAAELAADNVTKMSDLEMSFTNGRTLKCRILSCDPRKERMTLSLRRAPSVLSDQALLQKLQPGTIVSGVVVDASDDGLLVRVGEGGPSEHSLVCSLPMPHLADHRSLAKRLFEVLKPQRSGVDTGKVQLIEDVMVLRAGDANNAPQLTLKPSLVAASRLGHLPSSIREVEAVRKFALAGYISSVSPNGAVVSFAGGLTGYVRKSRIADAFVPNLLERLQTGQTVYAFVEDVSSEKSRLMLSLRRSDLEALETEALAQRVQNFYNQLVWAMELETRRRGGDDLPKKLGVGEVVKANVKSIMDTGILLDLAAEGREDLVAFAVQAQASAKVAAGETLDALLLDLDLGTKLADVSLRQELVSRASRRNKPLAAGKVFDGVVELVKEDQLILSVSRKEKTYIGHSLSRHINESEMRPSTLRPGMRVRASCVGHYRRDCPLFELHGVSGQPEGTPQPLHPQDLTLGAAVAGRVNSIHPMQVNVAFGKAGVGRIHITEALDTFADFHGDAVDCKPFAALKVGSEIDARVVSVRNETAHVVELSLRTDSPTEDPEKFWARLSRSTRILGFVKAAKPNVLWISVSPAVSGRVNAIDSGRSVESIGCGDAFSGYKVGDAMTCYVTSSDRAKSRLDLSLLPIVNVDATAEITVEVDRVQEGECVRVQLPGYVTFGHRYGQISFADIADDFDEVRRVLERLRPGSFTRCVVLPSQQNSHDRIRLSVRPSRVSPSEGFNVRDREIFSVKDLEVGEKVRGFVKHTTAKGCFVVIGTDVVGRVLLSNLSDHYVKNVQGAFPPGKLITARVQTIDESNNFVELTLRSDMTEGKVNGRPVKELQAGTFVSGVVKSISEFGIFIRLGENVTGLCHKSQVADGFLKDVRMKYSPGQRVRAKVIKVDLQRKRISLTMKPSELVDDPGEDVKVADYDSEAGEEAAADGDAAMNDDSSEKDSSDGGADESMDEGDGEVNVTERKGLSVDVGFEFSDDERPDGTTAIGTEEMAGAEQDGPEASDSEEDAESGEEQVTRKKSSREKRAKKRAKEEQEREIRRQEESLQASMDNPETSEDFERLLMGMPNSSFVWIKYMALCLSLSQVEKARDVAERALKTINYRNEREKMNIWVAYVNLEAAYGGRESFSSVLERANKGTDSKELHLRLLDALKKKDKELMELVLSSALKKHRASKKTWITAGRIKFELGEVEEARKLLERSLLSLEQRKHIDVISKYAQFEYK